jgi:hypothetical protein
LKGGTRALASGGVEVQQEVKEEPCLRDISISPICLISADAGKYLYAQRHQAVTQGLICHADKAMTRVCRNEKQMTFRHRSRLLPARVGFALIFLAATAQYLLIATSKISGIESPEILAPDSPNYWAEAWQNRTYVSTAAKHDLAWDMIGLAINAQPARSQDQFHIHIDCLQPDLRALLAAHRGEIGTRWAELRFDLLGEHYFARRLAAAELATQEPVQTSGPRHGRRSPKHGARNSGRRRRFLRAGPERVRPLSLARRLGLSRAWRKPARSQLRFGDG